MKCNSIFMTLSALAAVVLCFVVFSASAADDAHKNRVVAISATEQAAVFCEPGYYTWAPPANATNFRLLIVGGGGSGGGGGGSSGGGGGGGQVVYADHVAIKALQTYSFRVGPGGEATDNTAGNNGQDSYFEGPEVAKITAVGGGGGSGNWVSINGGDGANGGGAGGPGGAGFGGQPTIAGGHKGGDGKCAGGGGMAADGKNGPSGDGGAGVTYDITGTSVMYGAGGGGCGAKGGAGGNGYGDGHLSSGEPGTGGGGGGGDSSGSDGGSGTVIVRYTVQSLPASYTVAVAKGTDASEAGFVAGGFTVTCSENVRNNDVSVRYAVSGTAIPARTYERLSGVVMIPAGEISATVPVKPLSDALTTADSEVVLTLLPDAAYTLGASTEASVTIVNDPNTFSTGIRYVSPEGNDANNGLTPATAYLSPHKAVHDFDGARGTVYLLPGTYLMKGYDYKSLFGRSCVEITNAVALIGVGAGPGDVVLTRDKSSGQVDRRIVFMNHPEARIANLTLTGGRSGNLFDEYDVSINSPGRGGNVHIGSLGGLVEDCIISDGCEAHWAGAGGNVFMRAGRVSRCRITGGYGVNNRDPASESYAPYGTAVCALGGVVENCLIYANGRNKVGGDNNGATVGLWNFARLLNCTIADNYSDYSGGVTVHSKNVAVRNCAIFGNTALQAKTDHSNVWTSKGNDDTYSSVFTNCAADCVISEGNTFSEQSGFTDSANQDYHLSVASVCRDLAVGYETSGALSTTDLDGLSRQLGVGIDVGCYEYDVTKLACDFTADQPEALISAETGNVTIKFTAVVEGEYSGTLSYNWDFNGDGIIDQTTTNSEIERKFSDCGANGYFTVILTVNALSKTATMRKTDYLHLAPQHVYTSPSSSGGTFPYDTPAKAAPDLHTALKATARGSTVHMARGVYTYAPTGSNMPQIDKGVTVLGETDDPADTVIDYPSSGKQSNAMLLMVNNAEALVANITLQGGRNSTDGNMAAGLRIGGNGGTVSNCVVRKCFVTGAANHAGVWMNNGLLTHSIIEENTVTNIDAEHGYAGNGNSRREQALMVDGPGRVENCLFRNMKSDAGLIILNHAQAELRNCTITDCEVSFFTENPRPPGSGVSNLNPRVQWPCYAIESVGVGKGKVYSTVIHNVKRRSFYDMRRKITWPESAAVPFTYMITWAGDDGSGTEITDTNDDDRHCWNCASSSGTINDACVQMSDSDFVDYAAGDLTPTLNGKLYDAGLAVSGWNRIVDLAGNPRVKGERVDIGCYEQPEGGVVMNDVYVDSAFTGTSYGTISAPFKTIREGCAHALSSGMRIFVRGGPDRSYRMDDCNDAAELAGDNVKLLGCDADWNPATDYSDPTNKMANLVLADDYASKSEAATGKITWDAPIMVSASGCTVSGIRCEFGYQSFKAASKGGTSLIRVDTSAATLSDITIENCWFRMKEGESALNCAGTEGLVSAARVTATTSKRCNNCTIRRCYAWMGKFRASVCIFSNLHSGTRVEQCFFENLDTLYVGELSIKVTDYEYNIISNIFRNCANDYGSSSFKTWLLDSGGQYAPYGGVVAYNIAVHDNGDNRLYRFMQHGKESATQGSWQGTVNIHHNTIVGYDIAIESPKPSGTIKYGTAWTPHIFDNLVIETGAMFSEDADGLWKSGLTSLTSSFKDGSTFYNNALKCGNFNIGTAKRLSKYDIEKNLKGFTDTTIDLHSSPPVFMNTTDPFSTTYYKMKVPLNPWVLNAWTGQDPAHPEFPRYIGAVEPQPGGFAVRIR